MINVHRSEHKAIRYLQGWGTSTEVDKTNKNVGDRSNRKCGDRGRCKEKNETREGTEETRWAPGNTPQDSQVHTLAQIIEIQMRNIAKKTR